MENPLAIEWTSLITFCDTFMGTSIQWLACEFVCQRWNIAKASEIYDFNFLGLRRLKDYFKTFTPIFRTPGKNIFRDDMVKLENIIDLNFGRRQPNGVFYLSRSQIIALERYKSDFLLFQTGINPLAMAENSLLTFEYEAWYILSIKSAIVLIYIFFFN